MVVDNEDTTSLLGLPFVVEHGPAFVSRPLLSAKTDTTAATEESPCFMGWLAVALSGWKQDNNHKFVDMTSPPETSILPPPPPPPRSTTKPLENDSQSCAATSANSSIEGDEGGRRERRRCWLRDDGIHIESLDFAPPGSPWDSQRFNDASPQETSLRRRTNFEYQEYLATQRFR